MKHAGTIFTIGIILVLVPLLGFPAAWKNFFVTVSGLCLCGIEFLRLRRREAKKTFHKKEPRVSAVSFLENKIPPESPKNVFTENIHDQSPQA